MAPSMLFYLECVSVTLPSALWPVWQRPEGSQSWPASGSAPRWPTGPTRILHPLLTACTPPGPHPATPSQTPLRQVGELADELNCYPHRFIFESPDLQLACRSYLQVVLQVVSITTPQRLMRLPAAWLPLLTLLLWASSPRMIPTSPHQQQVCHLSSVASISL